VICVELSLLTFDFTPTLLSITSNSEASTNLFSILCHFQGSRTLAKSSRGTQTLVGKFYLVVRRNL
jgi:hypothetical protein